MPGAAIFKTDDYAAAVAAADEMDKQYNTRPWVTVRRFVVVEPAARLWDGEKRYHVLSESDWMRDTDGGQFYKEPALYVSDE